MHKVSAAIPDFYEIICVNDPGGKYDIPHETNISDFVNDIREYYYNFQAAKKYKKRYQQLEQKTRKKLQRYCKLFKCKYPGKEIKKYSLNTKEANLQVEKQQKRLDELEAIREQKCQARLKEIEPERKIALKKWLNCESDVVSAYDEILKRTFYISNTCRLRIKDNHIETTMRAKVSIREAKILWHRIKSGKDIKGHKIDYYTVISYNGELKIGCHNIEKSEVNRIGKLLDQIKDS